MPIVLDHRSTATSLTGNHALLQHAHATPNWVVLQWDYFMHVSLKKDKLCSLYEILIPSIFFTTVSIVYRFFRKSELRIHKHAHSDERLFSCQKCSKSFKTKGKLRIHVKRHENKDRFKCRICSYTCSCKGGLESTWELTQERGRFHVIFVTRNLHNQVISELMSKCFS